MIVITEADEYTGEGTAAALGLFDGVHLGHRELIRLCVALARERGLDAAVCTFDPPPRSVLFPDLRESLLTDLKERLRVFAELGADLTLAEHFTLRTASIAPEDWIGALIRGLRVRCLLCGGNYTFGRGGRGNVALLGECAARMGCDLIVVPPVLAEGKPVSSTRIRTLLASGERDTAFRLAGGTVLNDPDRKRDRPLNL